MGQGETLEEAIAYGASIGITETDPSNDVDGWDASIKVAALSTVLMNHPHPVEVDRQGIRGITREMIAEAEAAENAGSCSAGLIGRTEICGAGPPRTRGPNTPFTVCTEPRLL